MARLGINTGTAPNDGTGDTLFQAGDKTNKNFSELYNFLGNGTNLASGFVTSITGAGNISVSGTSDVTLTGIAATSDINADRLVVTGVSTLTNQVKIVSDDSSPGRIDYYCETSNAHYTRVQAAPHSQYSGNATVTLPTSDGTILLTDGDGSALSGIVTTIVAGSNISINSGSGSVQISASSGAAVTDLQIGYASTVGDTARVVGTSVTQVNFVGTGYTVTVANNVATVRNLGMGMTTLNITSVGYGETIFAGNQISYTATASDANAKFHIEDNAGIQIGINYDSGIMGGGQNAAAGTYDVKLRAATFFGMSEPKNVRFVISPFTLTMNTMFGGTDSYVVMTDTNNDATFVNLSTYGVVAWDGSAYVIDRDASVYSDAQKHALYYDNSNNELYGYRRESSGNMTIRKWTSVSSAADGTSVGSGTQMVPESVCDQTLTEQSALRNGKDYSTLTLDAGTDDFDGVYNRQSFKANLDTGSASSGNALFNATDSYWWFLKNGDNSRMIIYDTVGSAWTYVYVNGANFSTAADGTAVGSPNASESQSISDAVYGGGAVQPASEYSEITYGAGTGIGNGAYQPFGNYSHFMGGAFAMKITTSGGLMNNFGTKASPNNGWSYGFTLEDPWVATGAANQMLCPESGSDGWHAFGAALFIISYSIYDYYSYGNDQYGPYSSGTGSNIGYQQSSANIANAGDTIQVRFDGTTYKMYINGVEKISTTTPTTYISTSATTNPVLTFGDTSSMNVGTIINDYADPAPWPFRIRDLWIANNGNISATDCVGVSTFRDRNIASWSEYSDVDVYITLDGSGVTAVKGSPTVERKSITFS
jgi:hypothetical protein